MTFSLACIAHGKGVSHFAEETLFDVHANWIERDLLRLYREPIGFVAWRNLPVILGTQCITAPWKRFSIGICIQLHGRKITILCAYVCKFECYWIQIYWSFKQLKYFLISFKAPLFVEEIHAQFAFFSMNTNVPCTKLVPFILTRKMLLTRS